MFAGIKERNFAKFNTLYVKFSISIKFYFAPSCYNQRRILFTYYFETCFDFPYFTMVKRHIIHTETSKFLKSIPFLTEAKQICAKIFYLIILTAY